MSPSDNKTKSSKHPDHMWGLRRCAQVQYAIFWGRAQSGTPWRWKVPDRCQNSHSGVDCIKLIYKLNYFITYELHKHEHTQLWTMKCPIGVEVQGDVFKNTTKQAFMILCFSCVLHSNHFTWRVTSCFISSRWARAILHILLPKVKKSKLGPTVHVRVK